MRRGKANTDAPEWRGFDWDAITPRCKTCGEKSGALNDASVCPGCRQAVNADVDAAWAPPSPAAKKPRQAPKPRSRATRKPATRRRSHSRGVEVDERLIVDQYQEGRTCPDLAREHGVTPKRIYRVLASHGVERRDDRTMHSGPKPHAYDPSVVEQVRDLYASGLSIAQTAQELGLTYKIVERMMQRHGIERRQRQSGRGDTLADLRAELQRLGVTPREVKQWALDTGLTDRVARGVPSMRLLAAYGHAHRTREVGAA